MEVINLNTDSWNSFLNECNQATFFHTPEWYEVWRQYAAYKYHALLFKFSSGREALLPIAWRKRMQGLSKDYFSGPASTYGGLVTKDLLSEDDLGQIEEHLRHYALLEVRKNPFQKNLSDKFFDKKDFTHVIDLKQGWDSIQKKWSVGHKFAAKKGLREGVQVKEALTEDWHHYYQVYLDTFARWKNKPSSKYSFSLYEILQQINPDNCRLWIASYEGKVIGGLIVFYFKHHAVAWNSAHLKSHYPLKAAHVLQYTAIHDAVNRGYHWYDLNPSSNLEGVMKFKKGFGAEKKDASYYKYQHPFLKNLISLRRNMKFNV